MSKINVSTITNRTGTSGPVLSGVTTATNGFHVTSGNVGVGTDNPGSPLEVNGGSGLEVATFNSHNADGPLINVRRSGTAIGFVGSGKNLHGTTGSVDALSIRSQAEFTIATGGSTERLRITSDGDVGVGVIGPEALLHVEENLSHSSTYYLNSDAHILIDNPSSDVTSKSVLKLEGEAAIVYGNGSGTLIFADRQNERLSIDSSGKLILPTGSPGIQFGATDSGGSIASQTLDDYEEGTWTPRLTGSTSGEASVYNHQKCGYVKVGNLVQVYGYLNVANKGNIVGTIKISDFPFAAKGDSAYFHSAAFGWYTNLSGITAYGLGIDIAPGSTSHSIVYGNGTGVTGVNVANITTNFACEWTFTYRTA